MFICMTEEEEERGTRKARCSGDIAVIVVVASATIQF